MDERKSRITEIPKPKVEPKVRLELTVVRGAFDKCPHKHVIVDAALNEVECADCHVMLNPITTLLRFAEEESRLVWQLERMAALNAEFASRKRTVCQHCGRVTTLRGRS